MDEAAVALTFMSICIGLILVGLLVWGIKSGQFHNVEDAKYQVFRKQRQSNNNDKEVEDMNEEGVKPDAH